MANLEVQRENNQAGDGTFFRFHSSSPEGDILDAEAEFLPHAGRAIVKFKTVENITAGLDAVVNAIKEEARKEYWKANPHATLRIDIDAGPFAPELADVAPRFGFIGPKPAGEYGTASQYDVFSAEFRLQSELPLAE
jgi:hypothetical protein